MSGLIALTFDTDHMSERRMEAFLKMYDWPGRAVMFCTQRYASLSDIDHEIAPHPYLPEGADWDMEIRSKRDLFPKAVGWRSHSLVFSQLLAARLAREGYHYASTDEAWGQSNLAPSFGSWGMLQMPIYYMDNLDFSRSSFWPRSGHKPFQFSLIERPLTSDGLFVFDFHPIHLMLNTPDVEYYMNRRRAFIDGVPIEEIVYPGRGAATFFKELCFALRGAQRSSVALGDIAGQTVSSDVVGELPTARAPADPRVHVVHNAGDSQRA